MWTLLVVGLLPKAMPALLTDIGFFPCVHTDVLDEVGLPHKLLVTHTAWESGLQRDAYNEKSKLENLICSFTPMQSIYICILAGLDSSALAAVLALNFNGDTNFPQIQKSDQILISFCFNQTHTCATALILSTGFQQLN